MSGDTVHVYIEDNDPIGVFSYPVSVLSGHADPALTHGIVEVPREQAERWAEAETAWEVAQAEMRRILGARREQLLTALAGVSGFENASRAASRANPRRGRPRR